MLQTVFGAVPPVKNIKCLNVQHFRTEHKNCVPPHGRGSIPDLELPFSYRLSLLL